MKKFAKKSVRNFLLLLIIKINVLNIASAQEIHKPMIRTIVKIGTGNILQNYYSIGLKLCNFIQKANPGIDCDVVPTKGSIDNLTLLKEGKLDLALVQSDIAGEAYLGTGFFAGESALSNLSQIFSLHDEIFTILVKDQDKIKVFGDLEGKNIVSGVKGSGGATTYEALKKYYNFTNQPINVELNEEDYADKLCRGEVDSIIMMTGHPNALTSFISHNCEVDFVSIEQNKIDNFLKNNIAFHKTILHKGFYPGITAEQKTIASSAILVATDKIDQKLLTNFINYFYNHFTEFKSSNILLQNLNIQDLHKSSILPNSSKSIRKE